MMSAPEGIADLPPPKADIGSQRPDRLFTHSRSRARRKVLSFSRRTAGIVRLMLHELNGKVDASLRLQEISTLLIQEGNLDALYERVLDAAVYLMAADVGSMQQYDPKQDQLLLLAEQT